MGTPAHENEGHLRDRLAAELAACEAATVRAWDEGRRAEQEYRARQDDADAAGQYVQINLPKNPYRGASQQTCSCDLSGMVPPAVHIVDNHAATAARTALPTALRALQAVMELHSQTFDTPWRRAHPEQPGCSECVDQLDGPAPWPCPTIQKIQEVYGDE